MASVGPTGKTPEPLPETIIAYHIDLSAAQIRTMLAEFTSAAPLATLPQSPSGDPAAGKQTTISHTQLVLSEPSPDAAAKRKTLTGRLEQLGTFAYNHPFLTTGFVIALLLVVASAYVSVQAFLGHNSIALFNAHPELSGGLTFMLISYSINLINMCRRAAIKDDLEARIHEGNAFSAKLMAAKELDLEPARLQFNAQVLTQTSIYMDTIEQLVRQRELIAQLQPQLLQSAGQSSIPPLGDVPPIPQIETFPQAITIPDHITDKMVENQLKQRSFKEKMTAALSGIGTYVEKHPTSVALIMGGLAVCALSGMGVGLYLHGFSNVYFLGALSLGGMISLATYGLSFIYEAYCNSVINSLETKLEELDKAGQERREALQREMERVEAIQTATQQALATFTREWGEFIASESRKITGLLQSAPAPTVGPSSPLFSVQSNLLMGSTLA